MRRTRSRNVKLGASLAALMSLVLVCVPASSSAYWAATSSPVSPQVSTATVQPPATSCTSHPGVLGVLLAYAEVSWDEVPGAASYEVWIRNESGTVRAQMARADPTSRTQDIRNGLLTGLLGNLLQILLGGDPIYAGVITVHASGWTSEPDVQELGRSGLQGIQCIP